MRWARGTLGPGGMAVLLATSGCGAPGSSSEQARVPESEARLGEFLEASLEFATERDADAVMSCVPDGTTDRTLALARYKVLESRRLKDTVYVAAEVKTVAEETQDPKVYAGYLVTLHVRTDTLHWRMTHDSASGNWGVCGYSVEGYGFGRYGADSLTKWAPPGASVQRMRALVDSLRGVP
jgi:hypothetical protein